MALAYACDVSISRHNSTALQAEVASFFAITSIVREITVFWQSLDQFTSCVSLKDVLATLHETNASKNDIHIHLIRNGVILGVDAIVEGLYFQEEGEDSLTNRIHLRFVTACKHDRCRQSKALFRTPVYMHIFE